MKKSFWKKGISLLLTLAMLCGLMVPTAFATEGTYSDTHGNWAEASIERWSDYGIIQGNNGKFNPGGQLTRAHMAAILSRLLVLPEAEDAGFEDVNGEWFADYINRCAAAGIMLGNNGYANPNATITRQQAVVMLARALGIAAEAEPDLSGYADADQVSDYAKGYMAAMAKAGIVKGTSATTLSPYANITRAATVTILDRAIEVYANEAGKEVEAAGTGLVLVVAEDVDVTAPEGTTVVVAAGVKKAVINGEEVVGGKTYQAAAAEEEEESFGGGGGGGSSRPPVEPELQDLTIEQSTEVSGGKYKNVTIAASVGDGEVTLTGVTITGDLIVQGGGSNTIRLENCKVHGAVEMQKESGEAPRLHLTNTPVPEVVATTPAIIEAADSASKVGAVTAEKDVTIKGENTTVQSVTVPESVSDTVTVAVAGGAAVAAVAAKGPTELAPSTDSTVQTVTAESTVTVASGAVEQIKVPAGAAASVSVNPAAEVTSVEAKGDVTIAAGTVQEVVVPKTEAAALVTVTVNASAAVNTVEVKGETTIEAADTATVNTVAASGNVTIASGAVETVAVKAAVEVSVGADATVADVAIDTTAQTTIKNDGGTVASISSSKETTAVTVVESGVVQENIHVHNWVEDPTKYVEASCDQAGKKHHDCSKEGCGETKVETLPGVGHKWDNGVVTTNPTCTAPGVKTYTCAHKNPHTRTESIPALGHTMGGWEKASDSQHVKSCTVCQGNVITANHEWDAGVVSVAATCENDGVMIHTCKICVEVVDDTTTQAVTKTEAIDAIGHKWSEKWTMVDLENHQRVCLNDPTHKDVAAHDVKVDAAEAPTCVADGLKEGSHCDICASVLVKQEVDPKLGHDFDVAYSKDDTGHWHKCSRCDETDAKKAHAYDTNDCTEAATCVCGQEKAVGQHIWNSGVITTKATCEEEGVKTFTCTSCGEKKTEAIDAIGHKWSEKWTMVDLENHQRVCLNDPTHKDVAAHDVKVDAAEAPTCVADGLKEGSHCDICASVLVKQEVDPKRGHDFDVDYSKDETGHWHKCSRCDVTDAKKAHAYDTNDCTEAATCVCGQEKAVGQHIWNNGVITKRATCEVEGVKTYTCTSCGEKKTEAIDAIGHKWSETWTKVNADTHRRICGNDKTHVETAEHVYDSAYDEVCDLCKYTREVKYPVYIRHHMAELGTVADALWFQNDQVKITVPNYGTSDSTGKLPVPTMRDGWTYAGWYFVVEDQDGQRIYPQDNQIVPNIFTNITSDLETVLKDAVNNNYNIYMSVHAEGIENGDFSVTLDVSSGDLEYKLNVPATWADAEDMYFLNFVNFDRAVSYSCSVEAECDYADYLNVYCVPEGGYYGAYEVLDTQGNVLASSTDFEGFFVQFNSGELSDDQPATVISNISTTKLEYEISGINSRCNYQLESPQSNYADVYFLGQASTDRKLYVGTSTAHPLSGTCTLIGVSAVRASAAGNAIFVEVTKPLQITVPQYTPQVRLDDLLSKAADQGLNTYLSGFTFKAESAVTRLQAAMLAAALMGLEPADAAAEGLTWPSNITDCSSLTADQKALITLLLEEEVMAPTSATKFSPTAVLTDEQLVKVLDAALGYPLVAINDWSDTYVPEWAWYHYQTLDAMDILDGVRFEAGTNAAIEDALVMFINAAECDVDDYVLPAAEVSNIRLKVDDWDGPAGITWDEAPHLPGIDHYEYRVVLIDKDGNKTKIDCGDSTQLHAFGLPEGKYVYVDVVTLANGGRKAGRAETNQLDLNIDVQDIGDVTMAFYPATEGNYTMKITGLTPDSSMHMYMGFNRGDQDFGYGRGHSGDTVYIVVEGNAADVVKNKGWYEIREIERLRVDGNKLEMTANSRGGWKQITTGNIKTSPTYGVSNINFSGAYMNWKPASTISGMTYGISLRKAIGHDEWIMHTTTNGTKVPLYTIPAGEYETVQVFGMLGDGEFEVSRNFLSTKLAVMEDPASTPANDPTFKKVSDGYQITVTGLPANSTNALRLQEYMNGDENRYTMEATANASGAATFTVNQVGALQMLARGCELSVITFAGAQVNPDDNWYEVHFVTSIPVRHVTCEDAVSYEVKNIRFEGHYLTWDLPTAVDRYSDVHFEIDLSTDKGKTWEGGCGTSNDRVATFALNPGTYTAIRIKTMTWKDYGNGNGDWVEQACVVATDVKLTVTQQTDLAATGVDVRFRLKEDHWIDGDGNEWTDEYYNMSVDGLKASTPHIFAVRYGNDRNFHDVVTDAEGKAGVNFWNIWQVERGNYEIYRMTSNSVTNGGKTAVVKFAQVGQPAKCVPCEKDHTPKHDADAQNIRMDGTWIEWDKPDVSGYYWYNVYMSTDDGKTWKLMDEERNNPDLFLLYLPVGTYNALKIEAWTETDCGCGQIIGQTIDQDFSLKITEKTATKLAAANFAPLVGRDGVYQLEISGLQPGAYFDMRLAFDADGDEERGSWGGPDADENGVSKREIEAWDNADFEMEDLLQEGYYKLVEFTMDDESATPTLARTTHGGWRKCVIGDPVTNAEMTLKWHERYYNHLYLEWPDLGYEEYILDIIDEDGNTLNRYLCEDPFSHNLIDDLPQPTTAGEHYYDAVLYQGDGNHQPVKVLSVLKDVFVINVAGNAVQYDIEFHDPAVGEHTVTVQEPGSSESIGYAAATYESELDMEYGMEDTCSADTSGDMYLYAGMDFEYYSDAPTGTIFDLRNIMHAEKFDNHYHVTMTPPSTTTYEKPASNTVEFKANSGSLEITWDFDEPDGIRVSSSKGLRMEFSTDGGQTWTWSVETNNRFSYSHLFTQEDIVAGNYNKFRVVIVMDEAGTNLIEWFRTDVDLKITSEPLTAKLSITPAAETGKYDVKLTDLYYNANDKSYYEVRVSPEPDSKHYRSHSGAIEATEKTRTVDNEYIADGYYRLRVFRNVTANGNAATMTVQQSEWTKCFPDSGSGDDSGDSGETGQVGEYNVSNIRFEGSFLKWTAASTTDEVRYNVYVKNAQGAWEQVSSTSQDLMKISGADFEGTYTGVKIETELESDGSVKAETFANDLSLTVTHNTAPTAAVVTYTQIDPNDDYYYYENVSGVTPNAQFTVYLRNSNGSNAGSFGSTANSEGKVVDSRCGSSNLAQVLKGGAYLVYEYSNYSVSADGKSLSYTATKLGDWTTFEVPPASNTSYFDADIWGALVYHWDYDAIDAQVNRPYYELRLSKDNGETWVNVHVSAGKTSKTLDFAQLEAGTYTKLKMVVIGEDEKGWYKEVEWFAEDINLVVTEETYTASVTVTSAGTDYQYEITGLAGSENSGRYAMYYKNAPDGYVNEGPGGSFNKGETCTGQLDSWIEVENGSYQLYVYYGASANNLSASYTMQKSEWTKFIPETVEE